MINILSENEMLQKGKEWPVCHVPGGQNTNQYSYTTARKIQAKG